MRNFTLTFAGLFSAAWLAACNMLNLDPSGKTQPATEETVEGTWRNAEPNTEGKIVRMTLGIDTNHTMVWSRRVSGAGENGSDWEYQRENWIWEVAAGNLKATKTDCEYANAAGDALKPEACRAPVLYDLPITVNGNAWKISEGSRTMLFRKD